MATTATGGIRDLVWAALDGGTAAPSAGGGTTDTATGTTLDVRNVGILDGLPSALALKFGVTHTGGGTCTKTPTYRAFAIWMENTTLTPTTLDRQGHLALVAAETTPIGTSAPHSYGPTNVRVIAVKARYLKLQYRVNTGGRAANISFGTEWAGLYNRSEI